MGNLKAVKTKGFSILELSVVIIIIGIMATLVVPKLFERTTSPTEIFIEELSALVQTGSLEALIHGKNYRVLFDFENNVVLEVSTENSEKDAGKLHYTPVFLPQVKTDITIPSNDEIEFKHFFIENKDELSGGLTTKKTWFFINAHGMVQQVTIVLVDKKTGRTVSLVSNPFSGQLVEYEGIKKP